MGKTALALNIVEKIANASSKLSKLPMIFDGLQKQEILGTRFFEEVYKVVSDWGKFDGSPTKLEDFLSALILAKFS